MQVLWDELNKEETVFVQDLIRASNNEIVRPSEVKALIKEGEFRNYEDWLEMQVYGEKFLPHICNERCQMRVSSSGGTNDTRCRKINNNKILKDITSHTYMDLPRNWSEDCVDRLIKIGLAEIISQSEYKREVKYYDDFFTTKRHIPPMMNTFDLNMSPVKGKTFSACLSMQNIQTLTNCGGVNKYVCKYIGKIDKQNYVVVHVDGKGQLVTKGQFLHNTKITS